MPADAAVSSGVAMPPLPAAGPSPPPPPYPAVAPERAPGASPWRR